MKITVYLVVCAVFKISGLKLTLLEQNNTVGSALAECMGHSTTHLHKIAMISGEVSKIRYANKIIKALSSPVMILNYNDDFSAKDMTFIVFSCKRSTYYLLFKKVTTEDRPRLIILWTWEIRSLEKYRNKNLLIMLKEIFTVTYLHQIYDVYILMEDENLVVKVYTYSPYGENHCNEVGPPLHIDTWNSTTKQFMMNVFKVGNIKNDTRRLLMKNLHGCPVHVLVKNRPPESVALMTADNQLILKGSGGSILSSLMKRYNFTVRIKLAEDSPRSISRDKYGLAMSVYTARMLIRELRTGKYDFAFGVFSYLGYFSTDMDLSQYYLNENFAFYVPCGTKKEILSSWDEYYKEFTASTWMFIGFVFFFVALVIKFIATILSVENPIFLSFWRNVFALWAVHVENNIKAEMITMTMRVVVISLMFYCTIISVAYRASLKSLLLAPWEENSITTWKELEQSTLTITGIPDMYAIFDKISKQHEVLRKLKKKFQIKTSSSFKDIVDEVTIKRKTAYFGPESMIAFYNSIENLKNGTKRQTICQVNKIVASSPASPFLMRKGSMFLHMINQVTNDMVQTGQMKQFALPRAVRQVSKRNMNDNHLPTSLQQLQGAFLLLLIGLALAFVTFLFENLWLKLGWFGNHKKKFTCSRGNITGEKHLHGFYCE